MGRKDHWLLHEEETDLRPQRVSPSEDGETDYLVTGRHPRRLGRSPDLVRVIIGSCGFAPLYEGRLNELSISVILPVETNTSP